MVKAFRFSLFLFLTSRVFSLGCDGICPECLKLKPTLKASEVRISKSYRNAEKEISSKYKKYIVEKLDDLKILKKEVTKQEYIFKLLKEEELYVDKEISKLLKDIKMLRLSTVKK